MREANDMSREVADTQESVPESKPAAALDGVPFPDKDWRERIARAKQARQEGREARRGKPLTFRTKYNIEIE